MSLDMLIRKADVAEIDENLIRHNLSPAEQMLAIDRRAVLIKAIEQRNAEVAARLVAEAEAAAEALAAKEGRKRAKKGSGVTNVTPLSKQVGRGKGIATGPDAASTRDLAAKMGVSNATISRRARSAKAIGATSVGRVIGTALDTHAELKALAALSEPEREMIVAKAEAEQSTKHPLVLIMWPDPEPRHSVAIEHSECSISSPHTRRIDAFGTIDQFELNAWM